MSVSDDFNRADAGSLGGNWTELEHGFEIVSNWASGITGVGGTYQWTYYSGVSWNSDHSSTVQNDRCNDQWGPLVRAQSGINGYFFLMAATTALGIFRRDAGSYTLMKAITAAFANGDTATLDVSGTTLTAYKNGTPLDTVSTTTGGSAITGGAPGIASNSNVASGGPLLNNWIGTGESGGGGIAGTFFNANGPGSITLSGAAETVNVDGGEGTVTVTGNAGTFNADNGEGSFVVA